MEFGVAVGTIAAVDYAQHGERLGFTRCWVPDTPLIRSNVFATMAAVALATKTIKIGSGGSSGRARAGRSAPSRAPAGSTGCT